MKPLLLTLVCVGAFSSAAVAQCRINLKIGAKLSAKCSAGDGDDKYVATAPSQFRPSIERVVAGVKYTIAFDEETRRVRYIQTIDRAFRAVNGLRIGSQIRAGKEQLTGGYGGWYTFAGRTPDGWDIIVADIGIGAPAGNWKDGETRTITVGGFKKGGN